MRRDQKNQIILGAFVLAGALWAGAGARADEPAAGLPMRAPASLDEPVRFSEPVKADCVRVGENYLRNYLREQMLLSMAAYFPGSDPLLARDSVSMLDTNFSGGEGFPWQASLRVRADSRLERYLTCGRFLPLQVRLDSAFQLLPTLELETTLQAPFDDVVRLQMGSRFRWAEQWHTHWKYELSNSARKIEGMNLGLNWVWQEWDCTLEYTLTAAWENSQRLQIRRSF